MRPFSASTRQCASCKSLQRRRRLFRSSRSRRYPHICNLVYGYDLLQHDRDESFMRLALINKVSTRQYFECSVSAKGRSPASLRVFWQNIDDTNDQHFV